MAGVHDNSSILSWHGADGNLTLNETLDYLFDADVGNVNFRGIENVENRFLLPFGMCSVADVLPAQLMHGYGTSIRMNGFT